MHDRKAEFRLIVSEGFLNGVVEGGLRESAICRVEGYVIGVPVHELKVLSSRHGEDAFQRCKKRFLIHIIPILCDFLRSREEVLACDVCREVFLCPSMSTANNDSTVCVRLPGICCDVGGAVIVVRCTADSRLDRHRDIVAACLIRQHSRILGFLHDRAGL